MADLAPVSRATVAAQARDLGVLPGGVLLVHAAFRRVRPVEDGPSGLIAALREALGPGGTLVMPSWTGSDDLPFDPTATSASPELGVIADIFWRQPGVLRSGHPFAMAAAGPAAAAITADRLPIPPHRLESPVGRVFELDGMILLLGVTHEVNSTLHLAELLGGAPYRVPKHITVLQEGQPIRVEYGENDHCTRRFELAGEWLDEAGLQRRGRIGHADALLVHSRDVVRVALDRLADDLLAFLHPRGAGCVECDAAHESLIGH